MNLNSITINKKIEENLNENEYYNWIYWTIKFEKNEKIEETKYEEKISIQFDLEQEKIKKDILLKILYDSWLIDKFIYNWIINENKDNYQLFEDIINFNILTKNIAKEKWVDILNDWKTKIEETFN